MPGVGRGKNAGAAGRRDRYVLIEQRRSPVTKADDAGLPIEEWCPLNYAWMSRTDLSADERFGLDQESAHADTAWVMPYQPDMDPERVDVPAVRRLVYDCRTYDILSASPLGWRQDIEIVTLVRAG